MAVIAGWDRDDPEYVKMLEEEYSRDKMELARLQALNPEHKDDKGAIGGKIGAPPVNSDQIDTIMRSLHQITTRLDGIETSQNRAAGTPSSPSSADLISSPLTKALAQLSLEEDDAGRPLRPETYCQSELKPKSRDYTKMDTLDLVFGWACVIDHLLSTGGDLTSYVRHVKYTLQMLQTRQFYDAGAIHYDRYIVDRFIRTKSHGFEPDPVGSSLCFPPRVIPESVEICHGGSLTKGIRSVAVSKQTKRRKGQNSPKSGRDEVPADFPADVCFYFNYRSCNDESCPRKHICRKCHGKHRADSCREKTKFF